MSEKKFQKELETLFRKFPNQNKNFTVRNASVGSKAIKPKKAAHCVEYGIDPRTGELICLKWE